MSEDAGNIGDDDETVDDGAPEVFFLLFERKET